MHIIKIKFLDELNGRSKVPLSVDGVHCHTNEPSHTSLNKNPKYYSHKFKTAGLSYELVCSTYRNALYWINGPFPASKHDKTILEEKLSTLIQGGRKIVADFGYRGNEKVIYANSSDKPEVSDFKGRARSRQEAFNAKIKSFKCLSTRFRHGIENHKGFFYAVCVICQYQLENESGLFDI